MVRRPGGQFLRLTPVDRDDRRELREVDVSALGGQLADQYDALLLDLDGVVYRGPIAVPHAAEVLGDLAGAIRLAYVTNNASRTPDAVAKHLCALGLPATADEVVTSAQAGSALLAEQVPPGSRVLVVGAEGLEVALSEVGLIPVRRADEDPVAVIQGFSPHTGWTILAEATYALRAGAVWVATNGDLTFPTEQGEAPGNGQFVELLARVTGRTPTVAGKPFPALMQQSVQRVGSSRPLVVGDRLDTDIAGAVRIGADSLLVLTGITSLQDACLAEPGERPTYVGPDLRVLQLPVPEVDVVIGNHEVTATGPGWRALIDSSGLVTLHSDGSADVPVEGVESVWAGAQTLAECCWAARDHGLVATAGATPSVPSDVEPGAESPAHASEEGAEALDFGGLDDAATAVIQRMGM